MLGCTDNQSGLRGVTSVGRYVGRHRVRPLTVFFSRFAAKTVRRVILAAEVGKTSMGLGGDRRVRVI